MHRCGYDEKSNTRRVLIDFAGGDLDSLNGAQPVRAEVKANGADVDSYSGAASGPRHLARGFRMTPKGNDPGDMRCSLNL